MIKVVSKYWGMGLALNLLVALVIAIISGIISFLFAEADGAYVFVFVASGIVSLVGTIFLSFLFLNKVNDKNYFIRMREKKIPVKRRKVNLTMLLLLLMVAVWVGLFILVYSNIDNMNGLLDASRHKEEQHGILSWILGSICIASAVFWFGYFCAIRINFEKRTCEKCHNVDSYVDIRSKNYEHFDRTETKTKDYEGSSKVGAVYAGSDKVGDVYKNYTYTRKRSRRVMGSVWDVECECIYCKNRKEEHKSHISYTSDWK